VCDALQTNNIELLGRFGHLNRQQAIFPNQVTEISAERKKSRPESVTIGWGGSYGHLEDLQWIVPALASWFMDHRDVKIAIMGSEEIFKLFENIPLEQKIYRKPGSIKEYYHFLDTIDIGLAPLKDTAYNRCRSDVKFIEYAAHGVVPVLQDLAPYQKTGIPAETRYLFKNPPELVDLLNELVAKPELQQKAAQKAFEHIKRNRLEEQHAAKRLEFYLNLFKSNGMPMRESDPFEKLVGHIPYSGTDFEHNLYNGLIYSETRNMPQKALECFKKAERLAPDHYQPNLFMFKCVNNPKEELQKALQKNPQSLKSYMLLGEAHDRESMFESALNIYKKLIQIFPDYEVPYLRCADILNRMGMVDQAQELQKIANQINPWRLGYRSKEDFHDQLAVADVKGKELYLIMSRGNNFGWGICGKHLAKELSVLVDLKYITDPFNSEDIGDELDFLLLQKLQMSPQELERISSDEKSKSLSNVVIQAIDGTNLLPWGPEINAAARIGYTFFEESILSDESIHNARNHFSIIVAGSKWCENVLQEHGLQHTKTIIQGIEPSLFNPYHNQKEYFKDRFVIFSGGKLELRKGQDLVIRAFKHLRQKYKDVLLVTAWNNIWPHSLKTMQGSPYIEFKIGEGNFNSLMNNLLAMNGISPESVINLPPQANVSMPKIYKNTDIGLFPNRCEGGTNLVLMEYMACGKPTIASFSSGHKDILTEKNAFLIKGMKRMEIQRDGNVVAYWDDPDLDEIIDKLEWAYLHRDRLDPIGQKAGQDLAQKTWKEMARQFYDLAMDIGK